MREEHAFDFYIFSSADLERFAWELSESLSLRAFRCACAVGGSRLTDEQDSLDASKAAVVLLGSDADRDGRTESLLGMCCYKHKPIFAVRYPSFSGTARLLGFLGGARDIPYSRDAESVATAIAAMNIEAEKPRAVAAQSVKRKVDIFSGAASSPIFAEECAPKPAPQSAKPPIRKDDLPMLFRQAMSRMKIDRSTAIKQLQTCAKAKYPPALIELAKIYDNTARDNSELVERLLRTAYTEGDAEGAYRYAQFVARFGNYTDAEIILLENVKNSGHMDSVRLLAEWYAAEGVLENPQKEAYFSNMLIEKGNTSVMLERARAIMYSGDKNDEKTALDLLKRANRTNPDAGMEIADYYFRQNDSKTATDYLKNAAERDCPRAQYMLGRTYAEAGDISLAAVWLRRASVKVPEAAEMLDKPMFSAFRKE